MPLRLKRSIFIGIGGTGIETIAMVKSYFKEMSPGGEIPPMVKFLAVDTDSGTPLMQEFSPEERVDIAETRAVPILRARPQRYATLPNPNSVRSLSAGAGQIRSLGKFAVSLKEYENNAGRSFSGKFANCYNAVQNINQNEDVFKVLGNDVNIHIVFSLSGGTGSGAFLSIAYLIRQFNPNLRIVGYAFSHNFFINLPTSERVKQNAYGALLELDYCMHANNPRYQDIAYPKEMRIEQEPFDIFMYIDNKTYTNGGADRSYVYQTSDKSQVEKRVAYAMVVSSGDMGAAGGSVWDNLLADINGGTYDVQINDQTKKGWVSSLGVGEIICANGSEKGLFADNLAIKLLKTLLSSHSTQSSAKEAYEWVKEFDINESSDENDSDAVIRRLIPDDDFINVTATEVNQDSTHVGKSDFFRRVAISQKDVDQRRYDLQTDIQLKLKHKLMSKLFPQSDRSEGLSNLIAVLKQFKILMADYAAIMAKENTSVQSQISTEQNNWKSLTEEIIELKNQFYVHNRDARLDDLEQSLKLCAQNEFKADCQYRRRESAQKFFENMSSFVAEKITALETFGNKVSKAIESEEEKVRRTMTLPSMSSNEYGTINLTKEITSLNTTSVDNVVFDLSDFLASTKYDTIEELAGCTSIDQLAVRFAGTLFNPAENSNSSVYPIIRILKNLPDEALEEYLKAAISKYSTPLMDIDTYGEAVKDTQHIYIAIPGGESADHDIKEKIRSVLGVHYQPKWVDINDPNRILIYRQIGVIPPYFISGVSIGRNGFYRNNSCQEKFEKSLRDNSISAFTDTEFEDRYINGGFRLDSEKRENAGLNIKLWVQSIICGLIQKTANGSYRIASPRYGRIDPNDPRLNRWVTLGQNRDEAYESFASNTSGLREEIQTKITSLMESRTNKERYESFIGPQNALKYLEEVSMIDRSSSEWENEGVQDLFTKELDFLQNG